MARRRNTRVTNGRSGRARRRPNAKGASRSVATRVLATGVGASVPKAFGSVAGYGLHCWDAKHLAHLPLPRAVGPYTTIRATRRIQISTHANVIGTFQCGSNMPEQHFDWSEAVMVTDVVSGSAITAPSNAQLITLDLGGLGDAATLVPSALSVQIMCPTALQSASGIVYAGVMNTQTAIAGRNETWDSYMEKFVQFQNPRLLAASKLALRGVQINSYPLNMTEVSKFTPLCKLADSSAFTLDGASIEPAGWAPIVIFNPSGASLELLITMEFRVRFDLDHPASASHTHHPVASDALWDRMVKGAVALGNGVVDIADVVANTGMAVGRAVAVGSRLAAASRAMPALAV
ncbi:hypothetical protein [Beihai weivirus-like virus 21]|uniref:hypothetical protein n=1 Tax=Beihai weivirus-like virus 21 TaxID=1922750 RepID=UPI00090B0D60|nr:hypothetical protein [Beihai weivirus-like virus 21]APG78107.1 hypothetical protein [Beihai weivirus-like virus 21]